MQPQADPLLGQLVSGRYRIKQLLGTGGMGQVYLAEHEAIQKNVALKVLHLHYSKKADIVTRFRQEAISASRIKHPNVLEVFDFGQLEDGSFYLAMEFLEGCDLADDLKRRQKLDTGRALSIAMQICRALSAAHKQGVVHRDMKPENVFLQRTADGEEIVKIVDFGIAQLRSDDELAERAEPKRRLTKTGMIFGTPEYMAPEQAAGRKIDLRVDVYAVGVILYELFSGAVPFTGDSFLEVLNKHLSEAPPKMSTFAPELHLSQELEAVIERALAKRPEDRYSTMGDFAQALLSTPEGTSYGSARLSAVPELSSGQHPLGPGAATAAQFLSTGAPQTQPSAVAANTASSDTQLEGSRSADETTTSSPALRAVVALGALALVGALGVGAFMVLKSSSSAGIQPDAERIEPPEPSQKATASAAPAPAPAPPVPSATPAEVAPTTQVSLSIVTQPSGAVLLKDGFQVCDSTPCEVSAAVDEAVEFEASKGRAKGSARVLAQRDQTVSIKLEQPQPKPRPRPPKDSGPEQPRMCEVEVDGLKILRPCAK